MRILTIIHELPPNAGGAGIAALTLASELAKAHSVDILAPRLAGQPKVERLGNITIHRIRTLGDPHAEARGGFLPLFSFASFMLAAFLRGAVLALTRRYSIIHSHFVLPSGLVGVMLSRLFGIPCAVTVVEADVLDPYTSCTEPYRNPLIRGLISLVIRSSSAAVAISSYIKNMAESNYAIPPKLTVVSYGASKPEFFPTAEREQFGFAYEDFLCVSIGRLVPRKGFDVLIKAASLVDKPRIKFAIIGNGPERSRLVDEIRKRGLTGRVKIFGRLDDIGKSQILSFSDLFVLPSLREGYGIVLIEAMLYTLPIVSTNFGGQSDILKNGENCIFVDPGNAPSLAAAIKHIAADSVFREKMRVNNMRRAGLFTHANAAANYSEIFDSLRGRR